MGFNRVAMKSSQRAFIQTAFARSQISKGDSYSGTFEQTSACNDNEPFSKFHSLMYMSSAAEMMYGCVGCTARDLLEAQHAKIRSRDSFILAHQQTTKCDRVESVWHKSTPPKITLRWISLMSTSPPPTTPENPSPDFFAKFRCCSGELCKNRDPPLFWTLY